MTHKPKPKIAAPTQAELTKERDALVASKRAAGLSPEQAQAAAAAQMRENHPDIKTSRPGKAAQARLDLINTKIRLGLSPAQAESVVAAALADYAEEFPDSV